MENPKTTKTPYAKARDLLTRYLARRDHSRYELRTKLNRRFEPEVVEFVIREADEKGLIPDEATIAERAVQIWLSRQKSWAYIEGQLQIRGLPIRPMDSEIELEVARSLLEKKFGEVNDLSFEQIEKAHRFMINRGFNDCTIRMVLNGRQE